MSTNSAAYLPAATKRLEVKEAPYPTLGEDQILIQNRAVAINPVDIAIQQRGTDLFSWLQFPYILGFDCAGDVVAVGSKVDGFKVGDRAVAQASAAFQNYTPALSHLAARIPESMRYEDAAVLPLCFYTAAAGLFGKDQLGLAYPKIGAEPKGQTVLIWGGATSVGSNGIQLAVAAGYEVISTSSPKNFEYVKKLGASQVFDYNSPTVEADIIAAFDGKKGAGAMAIASMDSESSTKTVESIYNITRSMDGPKLVALAMPPPGEPPVGITARFIDLFNLREGRDLGAALFNKYLSEALVVGTFTPSPPAQVVAQGLEGLQVALDACAKGVSAKKIVVTL